MTGSLQIKNDTYYMVLNTKTADNKRQQKWIKTDLSVKGNKKRAEQMLRNVLQEQELQQERQKGDGTVNLLFCDVIRFWLKEVELQVDEVTMQGYVTLADRHIFPYFEPLALKLNQLTRGVLQGYINQKFESGRIDGKGGLSPTSLRLHKNILNQSINHAIKEGWMVSNPCAMLTLPQMQLFQHNHYTAQQMTQFLDLIHDEPLYPLIQVTVLYGLRRSEVLGLRWDSVDFQSDTLSIRHTVSKVSTVVYKDKTKNNASYRTYPLMPDVKRLLLELKGKEQINQTLFGREYQKNDYR